MPDALHNTTESIENISDSLRADGDAQVADGKPSPEVLEWARAQHTPEEVVAFFDEMRASGGLELKEFISELKLAADAR